MPYKPGITYHGDQHIMAAGAALANGIREFRDQRRRSEAADATMEAIVQAAGVMKQQGMLPDEFANKLLEEAPKFPGLSTSKKEALVGAVAGNLTMLMKGMADKAQAQEREVQNRTLREIATRRESVDASERAATAGFLAQALPSATAPEDPGLAAENVAYAAQAVGGQADPRVVLDVMRMARESQGGKFVEDPKTGVRFMVRGNTVLPSGGGELATQDVTDENGKVVGTVVRNPRGGFQVVRSKPEAPEDGTPVPGTGGVYVYAAGKPVKRDAFEEMLRQRFEGAPPAASAAGPKVRKYNPQTRKLE